MYTNNPNPENTHNSEEKPELNEKKEKLKELQKEEEEMEAHQSGRFDLKIRQIEELMGLYKERDSNLRDLAKIKEYGGSEGIMAKLKTDPKRGIDKEDDRENDFGSNRVFVEPVPPFCSYVLEALEDLIVRILIILVVTLVGSITNYQKETKFHELNDILVGDLINIMVGDILPGDLILIEENKIKMVKLNKLCRRNRFNYSFSS